MSLGKEKIGFWCPPDIEFAIQELIDQGVYQDKSKACVDLIRKGLKGGHFLPQDIQKRLDKISISLERDPAVVARQCVQEVLDMLDASSPITPLIVSEIKLRQARVKKEKLSS